MNDEMCTYLYWHIHTCSYGYVPGLTSFNEKGFAYAGRLRPAKVGRGRECVITQRPEDLELSIEQQFDFFLTLHQVRWVCGFSFGDVMVSLAARRLSVDAVPTKKHV